MRRVRVPLLVPVAVGLGLVLGLWSAEGRASKPMRPASEPAGSAPRISAAAAEPLRAPAPLAAPAAPAAAVQPSETAGEFLAAWYGERWPALEREIVQSGLDLDQPYSQRPWEEVAPALEARLGLSAAKRAHLVRAYQRWPETVDVDYVRREFSSHVRGRPLDESDAAAIAALVEPANAEIAAHAELYTDLLDSHVRERWRNGRYVRSPFTTAGLATERGFHSESHGADGWAVTITLKHEDCPDLVELVHEMDGLCRQRDGLVVSYLRER